MTHHSAMRKKLLCLSFSQSPFLEMRFRCSTENKTWTDLLLQPVVQQSQETAWRTGEDDAVWRSATVCSHSEIYECVFLLSSGPGLWPHWNLWSRHHHRGWEEIPSVEKNERVKMKMLLSCCVLLYSCRHQHRPCWRSSCVLWDQTKGLGWRYGWWISMCLYMLYLKWRMRSIFLITGYVKYVLLHCQCS